MEGGILSGPGSSCVPRAPEKGEEDLLGKEFLDFRLRAFVISLADGFEPDDSFFIDQVLGRPVAVAKGIPVREIVVHHDRVGDVEPDKRFLDVCLVFFESELWSVIGDDDQSFSLVSLVPRAGRGDVPDTVDSTEGPHLDEDHFSSEVFYFERFAVQPRTTFQFRGDGARLES